MSEYMEQHSVARLVGAPPGYIGHDEEGQLTGAVRSNPFSVILLDEIEKAHPRVLDLFLQVFDEGHLTDAQGRRASFQDAIIILTSNLGTTFSGNDSQRGKFGFAVPQKGKEDDCTEIDEKHYRQRIDESVREALRPELLNRIDELVYFYPLNRKVLRDIVDKFVMQIQQRLRDRRIILALDQDVYDLLSDKGFHPDYGAREMERVIERLIVQPLGARLLEDAFNDGDTIRMFARDKKVEFEKA